MPQVPAGATIPAQAKKLAFKLLGFTIEGEFEEFVADRKKLEAPLVGRRVTVADVFEFADKLQQVYARGGYPLARVVILPQEIGTNARIKLRVIDGFVERMDLTSLPPQVRQRVAAVLAPLQHKTHLKQSELERRLLIAGDTPGLVPNAVFAAGKEIGGSVLLVTGRYRPVSVSVYTDNSLPRVFGTGQVVTSASLNSMLGLGEQLTVAAAGLPDRDFFTPDPTRRYLSATAFIPLGIDSWRLEFGFTDGVTTPRVDMDQRSQGLLKQAYIKTAYDLIKLRDGQLTFNARLDATDEEIDTLVLTPPIAISLDRVRALRAGFDGIRRFRETGTTVAYGATYSRGLSGLGARTAADATFLLPLSRQGADAVFNKLDGRVEITQALPSEFVASVGVFGQTSFNHALLTSELFDIDGAKILSGFTAGSLAGDSAWAVRGELSHPFLAPIPSGALSIAPYVFAATGERIFIQPTSFEIGSVHATNYGTGVRFNGVPGSDVLPDSYGFIEWSHRYTGLPLGGGDRIFLGMLLRY